MAQYQGRIAKLADKDNNTVVPITNARAVEVSKNRNLEAIVDKVDDMENVAQRVFNNSITPIITPIQTSVQRLDGIEAKANANTTKVNQLEQKQTSDKNELTNTLNGVKQNVQTIEGNVTNTSNTVTQHTQQITDLEYSVGEVLPKAEEAVAKVDGILGEKYIDCVAQGKMTQVGKQADGQVVAIDNSFAKEVMLKGQTLVNMFEISSKKMTVTAQFQPLTVAKISVQIGKKYYIKLKCSHRVDFKYSTPNEIIHPIRTTDEVVYIFTSKYDSEVRLVTLDTNVEYQCSFILIEYQDGMENWDIPYFEGMTSVKNPVVTSIGKNLFDGGLEVGAISNSSGYPYDDQNTIRSKNFIPVGKSEKITISRFDSKSGIRLAFYNGAKQFMAVANNQAGTTMTAILPANAKYVKFHLTSTSDTSGNVQIEESPTSTPYEPHKSHTVSSTEEIILRSLPNGVCDTLNLVTGEYVQRIGEKKVNGTETWLEDTAQVKAKTHLFYSASIPDAKLLTSISERNFGVVCDNYIVWGNNYNDDIESVMINNSPRIYLRLSKEKATSVAKLKTYLTSNNFKIQYELATPIVKKVKLSNSPFMFKDGHIILSSANDLLPTLNYTTTIGIKGQVETLSNAVREIATDRQNIHDNQSLPVEKGTFMPRLVGEGGGVSRDYNAQEGSYQRIGNLVHIQLRIEVNDWYSCQGSFQIAGLPFASNNTYSSFAFGWASNLQTDLDNASLSAYMRPNTSGIALGFNEIKDGSRYYPIQNPNVGDRDSSLDIAIAGTYMID